MDENTTNTTIPPQQKTNTLLAILLAFSVISIIGLGSALWWALREDEPPVATETPPTSATGPCAEGAENTLLAGFRWYQNTTLGFTFAYPEAWGDVTIQDSPMGGVAGNYLQGSFSANENITFGGNATNYTVSPRGGMPTDNPGYLQAGGRFYTVQLWQLHNPAAGTSEPAYALYPIEDSAVLSSACNTKAVVSQYPYTEFMGFSYDVARFNLQPENVYYGVNMVVKNPDEAVRAQLQSVIGTFQLFE